MENKEYYVELAFTNVGFGLGGMYYEAQPLSAKKMLEYCSDLMEISPELINEIDLSGKTAVQELYSKIFYKPHAYNVPGKIFIVYATSEEEALGKALKYNNRIK